VYTSPGAVDLGTGNLQESEKAIPRSYRSRVAPGVLFDVRGGQSSEDSSLSVARFVGRKPRWQLSTQGDFRGVSTYGTLTPFALSLSKGKRGPFILRQAQDERDYFPSRLTDRTS
jgi:hypothetical protein